MDTFDETYDVVVLGAGAGGMTAALVSALEGLRVLLIEASDQVGGTTARSSGTVWIPDNPYQRRHGDVDDAEAARTYLDALVGARAPREMRQALITTGPRMLEYLEARIGIGFRCYLASPDYRQDLPGAARGLRALEPLPFDGRTLGSAFGRLRAPLPELSLFGGMMVTRGEAARLVRWPKPDALLLGMRLTSRYLVDLLRHRRGTRLVLGNALAARLFENLLRHHVPIRFDTKATRLVVEQGRVTGLRVEHEGRESGIHARCAVVLAGGGFPGGATMRARHLPDPTPQYSPAFEGCTGATLQLALDAGAVLGPDGIDNALWFPSSIATRNDGSTAVYPHIVLDRAKPGLVAVNAAGERFVDEAVSYHEFVRAMYRAHRSTPTIPATLVCDRRFIRRYGLGMIHPRSFSLRHHIDSGYLVTAPTLAGLAAKIGVDAQGLAATIERNNADAETGVDRAFGKGGNPYDIANGDPRHTPNPCIGAIDTPPYFAVAVVPTPLATSLGLLTTAAAEVCDGAGNPIGGLYACGNDMHSPLGGEYPGPGAQLGPAMTFGYIAAMCASRTAREMASVSS
jgi:succinate dehydrogenase/fumarate reductase flavoprotein subunit